MSQYFAGRFGFEPCSLETKQGRPPAVGSAKERGKRALTPPHHKSGFQKDAVPHGLPGYPLAQTRLCATPAASQPNIQLYGNNPPLLPPSPALHVLCFSHIRGVITVRGGMRGLRLSPVSPPPAALLLARLVVAHDGGRSDVAPAIARDVDVLEHPLHRPRHP